VLTKIAFVTDGGSKIGMGHIQQSTTLARELMIRADICFLTKSDAIVVRQIERYGSKTIQLDDDSEVANLVQEIRPDVVVIDKPYVQRRQSLANF
jgi:spore coat polysaccharide biosynthesis predicted glycosyltransferase SpsG